MKKAFILFPTSLFKVEYFPKDIFINDQEMKELNPTQADVQKPLHCIFKIHAGNEKLC